VYYKNLKFYVEHGLILSKIHRVIKFEESAWLAPWIELCTEGRKKAKTQFQSDQWKLMANSVYGKSMENKRLHKNFKLIADPDKLSKAVSNPAMRSVKIVNGDLCLVENEKPKICLDKPIYAGFVILEVSKLHMFRYLYDYLLPTYSIRNLSLLYTDTDSFIFSVRTRDLHADMHADSDRFDMSNFPADHYCYSSVNKRVCGKMKSETGADHPIQFCALRAKMYSLLVKPDETKLTAKGIKKYFVEKNLKHEDYVKTLQSGVGTMAQFNAIQSRNHVLKTVSIKKSCLSAFDDKRYLLRDGIRSLAYGHYKIASGEAEFL
jgi:hypothetical protein